jgi:hypothetical protein
MATGLRILLTVWLLCVAQITRAEPLPDPTLPAIDLNSSGNRSSADVVMDEAVTHGLQSIIISPKYRAAIINGETVSLGGMSGDSRLVEVRESSVVLQNAQGQRVLELFPRVSMKKNESVQHKNHGQENASGQSSLPENAVGGIK